MKKLTIIFLLAIAVSGCVTLPNQIDEVYLSEITEEEAAKQDKIGAEIIDRKRAKDKVEFDLEIVNQRIETAKKEINTLEANGELLVEKEKLYTLINDNENLSSVKTLTQENRKNLTQINAYLKYLKAKKKETDALHELRKTELAVKVAELDYEKAIVAKKYQEKRAEEFEDDIIDETEYKKFLDDQKVKLTDLEKEFKETQKATETAMNELKKTGYEVK